MPMFRGLPRKNQEKFSEFWQNFQTSENSTNFSNCVPIKNSEEKSAEILPANRTKKLARKKFLIFRKIFQNSYFFLIGLWSTMKKFFVKQAF
jgi:hypothetical protein